MFKLALLALFAVAATSVTALIAPRGPDASAERSGILDARATVDSSVHTGGYASFFYQRGMAGACGQVNSDSALIASIAYQTYGNTASKSPLCGEQVQITNTNNNKTVIATIADACILCVNDESFDLSVGAFDKIATEADGLVPITWKFVN